MNRLDAILEKRKSREKRSELPIYTFINKWSNAKDLLEEVNKRIHSKKLLREAKSHYVVSVVTALEVFFRDTFTILVNNYDFDLRELEKSLRKKSHTSFDFSQIDYILKNKISIGELIAEYSNFQNLAAVQSTFSSLFGLDFFTELKRYKWWFDRKKTGGFVQVSKDFYSKIDELIKLRHKLVHDINPVNLEMSKIEDMVTEAVVFANITAFFIEEKLLVKNKKKG